MFQSPLAPTVGGIPSGKHTKNYGKSPFLMGKSIISMAIFHRLPEGKPSRLPAPQIQRLAPWLAAPPAGGPPAPSGCLVGRDRYQGRSKAVGHWKPQWFLSNLIKWWFTVDPQLEYRKIQLIKWDRWWFNRFKQLYKLEIWKKGFEQQQ
jgi:hypothetical protein